MKKILFFTVLSLFFCSTTLYAERIAVGSDGGETCLTPLPADIGYRPSLFECNGNAAILFRGSFRNAYSVVLRRNGEKNDRDRFNPGCGTARCSPLKVQKKIELPEYQVNCLGDSGYGVELGLANRISIKFRADVTNARDPSQFEQYCLLEKGAAIN